MTLKQALTTLDGIIGTVWLAGTGIWVLCAIETIFPIISNLNFTLLNVAIWLVDAVLAIVSSYVFWAKILFTSRRLDKNQQERTELMWDYLHSFFKQASYLMGAAIAIPLCFSLIPFVQYLRLHPSMKGWTVEMTDAIAGNAIILRVLFFGVAVIWSLYFNSRFKKTAQLNEKKIKAWMGTYDFRYKPLHDMLSGKTKQELKESESEPYMVIGQSLETGDDVVQSPGARRQNAVVFGPIGAGKTSTWFLPQIFQDIKRIIEWFRNFAKNRQDPDWEKPYHRQQNLLDGLIVIETTNDLCTNVHDMAVAMGVPEEKIVWLDPDNPNTPSLNLLKGPVETATRTLTDIISGLKEDANDFFSQAERAHLTQHIYLLKEAAIIEGKEASFGELMRMYNDVYVVVEKREELRKYVGILKNKLKKTKEELAEIPVDSEQYAIKQTELSELDDKYNISSETLGWFDSNLVSPQYKNGVKIQQSGPHKGEAVVEDVQADKIIGLKNQLTEMSKKIGLRRVLFHDSDFDIDDFLKNGGILLCNTAKDSLGAVSAKLLGQIYALAISAATMRRKPNVDPMVSLYMDEFPDYVYAGFTDFAAQARKYNVPINIAAQSPAQLALKFGPDYLRAVFSVMLTRATFGDMGAEDAKTLSALFGTHKETTEDIQSQEIDLAADTTHNQTRITNRTQDVPNITPEEIMGMERFTMAVRIPGEKHSNLFDRVSVKRVDMAKIANDPDNFDLNNPKDKKAFEQMKAVAQHTDTEYDEIDKEISQEISSGQISISSPSQNSSTEEKTGPNQDGNEEVVPHYNADNDKKVNEVKSEETKTKGTTKHGGQEFTIGEDAPGQAPTNGSALQLDDGDDPFSEYGGNVNTAELELETNNSSSEKQDNSINTEQASKMTPADESNMSDEAFANLVTGDSDNQSQDEVPLPPTEHIDTTANYTKEQLKDLAAQSVLKSPNGGNGRFDNNLHTDDKLIKNSHSVSGDVKEPMNGKNSKEDDDKLLYLDKNGDLKKSDESSLEKPARPKKEDMKKNAIQNARLGFLDIKNDHSLTVEDKVNKLKRYTMTQRRQLAVLFPNNVDKIIAKFDQEIAEVERENQIRRPVLKGSDDLNLTFQKTNNANHEQRLSNEVNSLIKGFDDGPINVDGFDEDTSFNDKDPFDNQPGMHDDE
ncbi:MAG: type IV secretion system DNA-binding domain-containing protein [Bacteroides sp.]|nr:type IV secretion system DNA-binding domain-containing protein [Bacteroides sp.]